MAKKKQTETAVIASNEVSKSISQDELLSAKVKQLDKLLFNEKAHNEMLEKVNAALKVNLDEEIRKNKQLTNDIKILKEHNNSLHKLSIRNFDNYIASEKKYTELLNRKWYDWILDLFNY